MVVELEIQRDVLEAAIGAARRYAGTSYQRFLFVQGHVKIAEQQFRTARRYTYALYMRNLRHKLADTRSATETLMAIERELILLPTSNTGVNSDESYNLPLFVEE